MPAKPAVAAAAAKKARKLRPKARKAVKPKSDQFTSLRKSLKPGAIAIMLAGRFRGRRVVVLKQLPKNGPIVVTGPFKYNGVPLRRVNPRYVIATSTTVDVAGVDTSKITNDTFKRAAKPKRVKGEKEFMGDKAKKAAEKGAKKADGAKPKVSTGANGGKVSAERLALQKAIDTAIIASLKKDAVTGKDKAGYLKSVFTIKNGDRPHAMKF